MSQEILINITPMETRVALVENGVPQEIHVERNNKRGLVGNIYKGKVVRVLPGMQAAFIDIGEARTAFLHVDDLVPRSNKKTDAEPADISQSAARWSADYCSGDKRSGRFQRCTAVGRVVDSLLQFGLYACCRAYWYIPAH